MSLVDKLFGKKESVPSTPELKMAPKAVNKQDFSAVSEKSMKAEIKETAKAKFETNKMIVPHITEKATMLGQSGQYIFKTHRLANKIDVAREVSKIYKVKVVSVNFVNLPGKERKVGGKIGFKPGYKKAIVKLAKGQTIELK